MHRLLAFVLAIVIGQICTAQEKSDSTSSSCGIRISLLTCTPGEELYSTFGHSAVLVQDSLAGLDIIYNYGTFDFEDPAFYSKFVRGKLLYFVSIDEFSTFLEQYSWEQRGIIRQELNLSCEEKEKLFSALRENAKEENKYYKYDFVYDNCTTRLRDIIGNTVGVKPGTKNILPAEGVSFRDLIHEYLNRNRQYWNKLGIDILLGMPVDKQLTNQEAMFLPDYLLKGFDSTFVNGKPLVAEKKIILHETRAEVKKNFLTPFLLFGIIFFIITILSFMQSRRLSQFFRLFDFILFFICGFLGLVILFMWIGTDHQACRNNLNLLWALPTHFLIVFFIFRNKNWIRKYFLVTGILQLLLLITWRWLPQELNYSLVPIVGILFLRSFILSKRK